MAAQPAPYDSTIEANPGAKFPAEKGRYHLYVAYTCPFACRALAARNLKGLEDVIGLSVAHPIHQKTKPEDDNDTHVGWAFVDPETTPTVVGPNGKEYLTEGCIPDTANQFKFARDLFEKTDSTPRKFSVPVLWDTKTQTIVSEQSTSILRTLDSGFSDLIPSNVHLYPEELRTEIDAVNNGIVAEITMGFFKMMFADSWAVFESIAKLDELLAKQRYLVGKGVTEADVRMFHTLIRLDSSQHKTDKHHLTEFPNVIGYMRDLYQMPAMKRTVNWDHLRLGAESRGPDVVVEGPFVNFTGSHDRSQLV
ncbi:hypothetical protein JM18_009463 [Phytophthora kernoviae]|uniref:GST C-terminal domain-containing protein n=2 Tax=Phytophthora kernoviae TaxID=325452 RepID=A0A8T0LI83_9STRA|nr:hypothetical protein G195_011331 [Phytophthora kernoviae 00238/432]KAG2503074.1 hypothetical protein JM16_009455 [Phytophthora kernoviae]KAG2505762.1 hypothetical protein JM18_009463 [Phytophthora kernoviae]